MAIPIYIPTYINSVDYTPAKVQPRLLFYNGMLDCESYYIESASVLGGIAREQNAFPYFDNYNVVTGSFPTVDSKSLLFYNEESVYGQTPTDTLYSDYWETYVELLYNPRTKLLNASAIIPLADYFKMELNNIVQFRGNYYHLRAINDYSLKNGECSIQLLGPILPDSLNLNRFYYENCMGYSISICADACLDYWNNCGATYYYEYCMGYSAIDCSLACIDNQYCPTTTTTTAAPTTTTTTTIGPTTTTTTIAMSYCNQYRLRGTRGGYFYWIDCTTGNPASTLVNGGSSTYVCSRTVPTAEPGAGRVTFYSANCGSYPTPTTTTTTAAPTTTTTAAPTTTTTTTSTTTTSTTTTSTTTSTTTTTTAAPTTTTTTSTTTSTTTTTAAPTTTTTTTCSPLNLVIDYLVVAGGGGGQDGGGGAGGLLSGSACLSPLTYIIKVGNGGSGSLAQNGETSSISFTSASIAIGGGRGGDGNTAVGNGGSGGGGGYINNNGGIGTIGQGFNGGDVGFILAGGGGGGASQKGFNANQDFPSFQNPGNGGSGSQWLDGIYYAGGGGGGAGYNNVTGSGGIGGGGYGSNDLNAAQNGFPNTGGGGGGSYDGALSLVPGNGGSGIVKIRYFGSGSLAVGGQISYSGSYTYHTFTSSGTFTY